MDSNRAAHEPQSSSAPFQRLLDASRGEPLALLWSATHGPATLFTEPVAELRLEAGTWEGGFTALDGFLLENRDRRCVGFVSYDMRDDVEALPRHLVDDIGLPSLHFVAYAHAEEWPTSERPPPPELQNARNLHTHITRADYERRVQDVVEAICAGEIFQANLTQPFTCDFAGDPRLLFQNLCHKSPAPFAAYLETGHDESVLCSSMEEFLFVDGDDVRTRPIKGTRPRGTTPEQDRALLQELLDSPKDQAELAMIVDLLRNDLGKVARPGTVKVGPFPEHESYAQVHHTFATVSAKLREDVSLVDLLRATFPSGSITGAPKLRCMEILEELEVCRRGVYTGAIGWIGPGRHMHLNVAIRTMVQKDQRVRFNAGGGITADSEPALEYEETLHKARGMVAALNTELVT
jgi:para-aminobenzoate synthetase component I